MLLRSATVAAALALLAATAVAAEATTTPEHAPAGSIIPNTAVANYVMAGTDYQVSASVSIVVDQLLDVSASWQDAAPVEAPAGSSASSLLFKVSNDGNGDDSYALSTQVSPETGNGFIATNCRIFLDADQNGTWSNLDTPYPASAPTLAAGDSMAILVVCDIPDDAKDLSLSNVKLLADSNTLSGAPGTSTPDPDHPGVILVVGMTGNKADATGIYIAANVNYTLTSTQLVTDRSGGHVATAGSTITYTITATPSGSSTGQNLVLTTPIPEHTTYVPGTLTLDGEPVSDERGDGDGYFDPDTNTTVVKLGDVSGSSPPSIIRFQVTIN